MMEQELQGWVLLLRRKREEEKAENKAFLTHTPLVAVE